MTFRVLRGALAVALVAVTPRVASAQLDPLLFLKATTPNVIVAIETTNRMQRDADQLDYYDPFLYTVSGAGWEVPLGVLPGVNTTVNYYRKYINLQHEDLSTGSDKFSANTIQIVGDLQAGYSTFYAKTRLALARTAVTQAIADNTGVARFGLVRTRQNSPAWGAERNEGPVRVSDALQQSPTDRGSSTGKWDITRPTVGSVNGNISGVQTPLVLADAVGSNATITTILSRGPGVAGALIPAGRDAKNIVDTPLEYILDDVRAEAARLIAADTQCRNTIAVLVVGGGEGTTVTGANPATKASTFLNVASSRRVPIYVIAIAPAAADVTELQSIAANSGGQYFEITKAMIDATPVGTPVPEMVSGINAAVQHSFVSYTDFNTAPTAQLPYGPQTEYHVTSPIIGTVNLKGAQDISGSSLPNTNITGPSGAVIPQRSNVLLTTALAMPSFELRMRAFRVYRPEPDVTKPTNWKFVSDGTRLWVAKTPATAAARNLFTVLADGTVVTFNAANATTLAPYLQTTDAAALIDFIRTRPLGAAVSSTPAVMDPPSIDPPPDEFYPGFASANKDRRGLIFIGTNDGMLHAIDSRLGVEVWGFIPFNLLPKLKALRDGQGVDKFDYFVDSSPKIADVKVAGAWKTYLFIGEGPGGTFYQTFDVTLPGIATVVPPDTDDINTVLSYFSTPNRIVFKWAFPSYSDFDHTLLPYGDIKATASAVAKSVGETWSDPAVGQIEDQTGKFAVITGSGFFKHSLQQQVNRGGTAAGSTFYLLNVETGAVYDSRDVGNDAVAETVDNCAAVNDCTKLKNALQADPVATGPPDSRYVTKAYIGDLDGKVWRFDLGMSVATGNPYIKTAPLQLYAAGAAHPLFASMASVTVGSTQQYVFFGTGSDLLPSQGVNQSYKLIGVLDLGASGQLKFSQNLVLTDNLADDEKVTAFPAVAGDIVFFTTTTSRPVAACTAPDANLYALTFIGGPAYDNTGDNTITGADTTKVRTIAGTRATAPFIVDQHLVFGSGSKVQMFGDSADYNNGVGQVGIRLLSWREVR